MGASEKRGGTEAAPYFALDLQPLVPKYINHQQHPSAKSILKKLYLLDCAGLCLQVLHPLKFLEFFGDNSVSK